MARLHRRSILAAGLGTLAARPAMAQGSFPDRPVRLVVAFTPGGISDLLGRSLVNRASAVLGQPIVVENRPGAAGNIGAEHVVRSPADGYTVLVATASMLAINPLLYARMAFNPDTDLLPLLAIGSTPHVLVTSPRALPDVTDLQGLLAAARAQPGRITFGTTGPGGAPHLTRVLLSHLSRTTYEDVGFRGGSAIIQALLGGHIAVTAEPLSLVLEQVRAGNLRALAICADRRLPLIPDVPTAAEAGLPGLENGNVAGLAVRRETPAPIVARLNAAFAAGLTSPEAQTLFEAQGTLVVGGPPEAFAAVVRRQRETWQPVLANLSLG